MDLAKQFWVFDLDDTLYSEQTYVQSGYQYLINQLEPLFKKTLLESNSLAKIEKSEDALAEFCRLLKIPLESKSSLLWMYRLHKPDIKLYDNVIEVLEVLNRKSNGIAILTDGRSITQRQKMLALGLDYPCYISEEWGEIKPAPNRFRSIMESNPHVSEFIYVGDNLKKDFITPNSMGWKTIGILDSGKNIHSQNIKVENSYEPTIWIEDFKELLELIC